MPVAIAGRPAVRHFYHIDIEIVVREDRASYRRDPDRSLAYAEEVDGLGNDPVKDPMAAPGTIAEWLSL